MMGSLAQPTGHDFAAFSTPDAVLDFCYCSSAVSCQPDCHVDTLC